MWTGKYFLSLRHFFILMKNNIGHVISQNGFFFFSFHKSLQGYTEEMIKKERQPRKPRGMKKKKKLFYQKNKLDFFLKLRMYMWEKR